MTLIILALIFVTAAMSAACLPSLAFSLGHARLAAVLGLSEAVAIAALYYFDADSLWPTDAGPMGFAVPVTFAIWGALLGSLAIAGVAVRRTLKRV